MGKRGKRKKRKKKKLNISNVSFLLEIVVGTNTILAQLIGNFGEINRKWFQIILSVKLLISLIAIYNMAKKIFLNHMKYKRKSKGLYRDIKQLNKKKRKSRDLRLEEVGLKEKLSKKNRKCLCKNLKMELYVVMTVFILCIVNPNNAKAYWGGVKNFCIGGVKTFFMIEGSGKEKDKTQKTTEETDDLNTPLPSASPTRKTEKKWNTKWAFILEKPCDIPLIDVTEEEREEQEKQVFFSDCKDVLERIETWKENKRKGVDYKAICDTAGNTYYTYMDMETEFIQKEKNAFNELTYDAWLAAAPSSSERDAYIQGLEKLNQVEEEGEVGCYRIWNHLANDYQGYAQEYEKQTKNDQAILYGYVRSIYCSMQALQYECSEEEWDTTYHYLVKRYQDLGNEESLIPGEYKKKARELLNILKTKDKRWKG